MYKKGILLIGGVLLLTTGCGNKKLTCTMEAAGVDTETVVSFKNDKADGIKINMKMDMPEGFDLDKDSDTYKDSLEEVGYKNIGLKEDDGKLVMSGEIDVKEYLKTQNIDAEKDDTITYDALKENFEKANWTCK